MRRDGRTRRRRVFYGVAALTLIGGAWAWRGWARAVPEVDVARLAGIEFDGVNGTAADLPAWVRELDGRRAVLVGEMYDASGKDPVRTFELVYFGHWNEHVPPQIQRFVTCVSKDAVPFCPDPVRAAGTFHVDLQHDDAGRASRLFRLDVERVEPVPVKPP